jgi:hypothetical protein
LNKHLAPEKDAELNRRISPVLFVAGVADVHLPSCLTRVHLLLVAFILKRMRTTIAVCYSFAMISKRFAVAAIMLAALQAQQYAVAQSNNKSGNKAPSQASSSAPATAPLAASSSGPEAGPNASALVPGAPPTCEGGNCDYQPAHITVATPAPAPAPWPLQDRLAWGANVLLALLGYAGIMFGIQTLKKIERQSRFAESAAEIAAKSADAATRCAEAALLHAQAILNAERPWVLITIVPSRSIENGFTVIATNRGRGPAQVVSAVEETRTVIDESHLPPMPEYGAQDTESQFVSIILLPGEFMNLKSFCRDDVKTLCGSEEAFRRIENWEERIFLYGKITYRDLAAPYDQPSHETGWCCRYIHGRQKSGLVMAGSQEYNLHT